MARSLPSINKEHCRTVPSPAGRGWPDVTLTEELSAGPVTVHSTQQWMRLLQDGLRLNYNSTPSSYFMNVYTPPAMGSSLPQQLSSSLGSPGYSWNWCTSNLWSH